MKFGTIVVDPPWPIRKTGKRKCRPNQGQELDYPTLSLPEIAALPIAEMSRKKSLCFLWTIQKMLPVAFSILEGWGFRYLLTLTWDKNNDICLGGYHFRTEFVIVGRKGKHPSFREGSAFPSVFTGHSPRHSAKPDEFYDGIGQLGPGPWLDVFARTRRPGWFAVGNEVDGDDVLHSLARIKRQKVYYRASQCRTPCGVEGCGMAPTVPDDSDSYVCCDCRCQLICPHAWDPYCKEACLNK